jgi:carboxyl-terminal processing protease
MSRQTAVFGTGVAVGILLAVSVAAVGQGKFSPEQMQQLRRFTDVYGLVKKEYVEVVEDQKMIDGCIVGLLQKVDPSSAYFDKDEFKDLQRGSAPRAGVGIELASSAGRTKVVAPIEGTPAERAGVRPGDMIVKVGDVDTAGMWLPDVVKLLRGDAGTRLNLTLLRTGTDVPVEVQMTREVIRVRSVRSVLAASGIGYVRVTSLQERTPDLLANAINAVRSENGGALRGMVLDLRNNPGGLVPSAVGIAAAFLPDDALITSSEGRSDDSRKRFTANPADYRGSSEDFRKRLPAEMRTIPLVVLVNGGSASGSEIIAAALQDHRRATIVGEKTAGRASLQVIVPLVSDTAVKLTTAYWYTPSGRALYEGVTPDVAYITPAGQSPSSFGTAGDGAVQRAIEFLKR